MDTLLMTAADVLELFPTANPDTISPCVDRLLGQPVWVLRWQDWKSSTHTNIEAQLEAVRKHPRILVVHQGEKVDPRGKLPPYYLIRFCLRFTDAEVLAYVRAQNDPVIIGAEWEDLIQKRGERDAQNQN